MYEEFWKGTYKCQDCGAKPQLTLGGPFTPNCLKCGGHTKGEECGHRTKEIIYAVGANKDSLTYGRIKVKTRGENGNEFDGVLITSRLGEQIAVNRDAWTSFAKAVNMVDENIKGVIK